MSTILDGKIISKKIKEDLKQEVDVLKEKGKSWGCYALLCLGGLNLNEKIVIMEYYSKKGINIIYVDNYDELIPKINEIFNI